MDVTCASCGKLYDLDNQVPRILNGCGHTVCEICVLKFFKGREVLCPFDGIVTYVIDGKVSNLEKNSFYLDQVRKGLIKDIPNTDDYATERELRIPCAENNNHIAVLYCTKCESHYCQMCSKLTHRSISLSNHRMIRSSQKKVPLLYCTAHPQNAAELHCQDDRCDIKYKVMCIDCHLDGIHKDHHYETLQEMFNNRRKKALEIVEKANMDIEVIQNRIDNFGELPGSVEESQEYKNSKKEIEDAYTKNLKELNNWKISSLEAVKQNVTQKIEEQSLAKAISISSLEDCQLRRVKYAKKLEQSYEQFLNKLTGYSQVETAVPVTPKKRKLIFVALTFTQEIRRMEQDWRSWSAHENDISVLDHDTFENASREMLQNATLFFLYISNAILTCNRNLSSCAAIVFSDPTEFLREINYNNFKTNLRNLNVPVYFPVRSNVAVAQYILDGNFENNSLFERWN